MLDAAALERNIRRMAAFFADGPCRLRPHFKAHKTPEIARRQLAAGSCAGLTCATVSEAEAIAGLCDDVLIANEVIGVDRCARVARLARGMDVSVAVDAIEGLEQIASAGRQGGVEIGVLVDLDVGQRRCGVRPGEEALALAQRVSGTAGVRLRGLMGYEGHVQPVRDRHAREDAARAAMDALVSTADLLRRAHLPCEIVSAGGTGTFDISGRVPGVTEIQAGSYALMDTDYLEVGVGFEQAFWVLGTVISRPDVDRCVVDSGHKSMTKDHGLPSVKGLDGAVVRALNDEHATIDLPAGMKVDVGDRVLMVPSHVDPTVNLHDAFYVLDGDRVVDVWPIAARGYAEHRAAHAGSGQG